MTDSRMRIYNQQYNSQQHTDSNSLARAFMTKPSEIGPLITHLSGRYEDKFPLTTLTEGVGNYERVTPLDNDEYQYNIIGKYNRVLALAEDITTTDPGINGTTFKMKFKDSWFPEGYVIISPSGYQIKIMNKEITGNLTEYTVQPVSPDGVPMPADDRKAGSKFSKMYAPVARDYSEGLSSPWVSPGKIRQRLSTLRKSYSFSGNTKDQVTVFELPTKNGTSPYWIDFEEYQHFLAWKEECELYYWYGTQSYRENGETHLVDTNGYPIIVGPGLLEQIPNKESYSNLTERLLKDIITDLYFGMTDNKNRQLTIFTGSGGKIAFDEAMKDVINTEPSKQYNVNTFVTGSGRELELGGYFTRYNHIFGHTVNVVRVPMFDHGGLAEVSDPHPDSNLPLESYRMVFVDQSTYDGEANLKMFAKKGREDKRWGVAGSTIPRGMGDDNPGILRASDIDGASVHFLKTAHILLRRFDTSLDLQCIKS